MTSWLSDQAEKLSYTIPDKAKDTEEIWKWLGIGFLR